MDTLTVTKGTQKSFDVQISKSDGTAYTGFVAGDTAAAYLYAGEDSASLATPTFTWTDVTAGTGVLTLSAADTSTLTVGKYLVGVNVTRLSDGAVIEVYRAVVEVGYAPGSATALTTYCDYQDLLNYAPNIAEIQSETDLAGFANQRHLARVWYETVVQRKARSLFIVGQYTTFNPGNWYSYQQMATNNKWLQDQLDANKLMVKTDVIALNAYKALSLIYRTCVAPSSKEFSSYQRLGHEFSVMAREGIKSHTAELDLNGDGYVDIAINCGITSLRP